MGQFAPPPPIPDAEDTRIAQWTPPPPTPDDETNDMPVSNAGPAPAPALPARNQPATPTPVAEPAAPENLFETDNPQAQLGELQAQYERRQGLYHQLQSAKAFYGTDLLNRKIPRYDQIEQDFFNEEDRLVKMRDAYQKQWQQKAMISAEGGVPFTSIAEDDAIRARLHGGPFASTINGFLDRPSTEAAVAKEQKQAAEAEAQRQEQARLYGRIPGPFETGVLRIFGGAEDLLSEAAGQLRPSLGDTGEKLQKFFADAGHDDAIASHLNPTTHAKLWGAGADVALISGGNPSGIPGILLSTTRAMEQTRARVLDATGDPNAADDAALKTAPELLSFFAMMHGGEKLGEAVAGEGATPFRAASAAFAGAASANALADTLFHGEPNLPTDLMFALHSAWGAYRSGVERANQTSATPRPESAAAPETLPTGNAPETVTPKPEVTPPAPAAEPAKAPVSDFNTDLATAQETNEALNQRAGPGPERDALIADRRKAAERVASALRAGDKVGDFVIPEGAKEIGKLVDDIVAGEPVERATTSAEEPTPTTPQEPAPEFVPPPVSSIEPVGTETKVSAPPASEVAPTEAAPAAEPAAPEGRKFKFRGPFDTFGSESTPVASFIINDLGGLMSKRTGEQRGLTERNADLWEDAPKLQHPTHNKIYDERGQAPDRAAQALFDAGLIRDPSVKTMWDALGRESQSARQAARAAAGAKLAEKTASRQARAFDQEAAKQEGKQAILVSDLGEGDVVRVGDEDMRVTQIDPDTHDVTLEDGTRFGVQQVKDGEVVYGEIKSQVPRSDEFLPPEDQAQAAAELPQLRPGEKQGDLLENQTEDLRLVGEQGKDFDAMKRADEQRERDRAESEKKQQELFARHGGTPRIPPSPLRTEPARAPVEIIKRFADAIGKAYKRRATSRRVLGFYRPMDTLTAGKEVGDLDTTAHELAGHWLDDKHGVSAPWFKAPAGSGPFDTELAKFWVHTSSPSDPIEIKRAEGVAEYARALIVNPARTRAEAPSFSAYWDTTIPPKVAEAIKRFSDETRNYFGADPSTQAKLGIVESNRPSLIDRLTNLLRGNSKTISTNLKAQWVDALTPVIEAWRMAKGLKVADVLPSEDFELLARLHYGHEQKLMDQMERGLLPFQPSFTGKAPRRLVDPANPKQVMNLDWLFQPFDSSSPEALLRDRDAAAQLMIAERVVEKARKIDAAARDAILVNPTGARAIRAEAERQKGRLTGFGAGMEPAHVQALKLLTQLRTDPRFPRIQEGARRYRAWALENLRQLLDSGRISRQTYNQLSKDSDFYVNMERANDDLGLEKSPIKGVVRSAIGAVKNPLEKFAGSTARINDPYENLFEQTDRMQREAQRNRLMQLFTDMLTEGRSMHQGTPKDFDAVGSRAKSEDTSTDRVFRKGKPEYWQFAPDVHQALHDLGQHDVGVVTRIISILPQFIRKLITLGPQFITRNVIRDLQHRVAVSDVGSTPQDILRISKADREAMDVTGGTQFGRDYAANKADWQRQQKMAARKLASKGVSILDPRRLGKYLALPFNPKTYVHFLESASHKSELSNRLAEFNAAFRHAKTALKYSDTDAALYASGKARGLLDYAIMGRQMRWLNRILPFTNARVQGLLRTVGAAKNNPVAFGIKFMTYAALPALAYYAYQRADPERWKKFQQQPAYQKDFFYTFNVGGHEFLIPKSHETGVLSSGLERIWAKMDGDKHAFEGYGISVLNAATPVSDLGEMMGPAKTAMQIYMNHDTFRDRHIIPTWEEGRDVSERKGIEGASGAGKAIARALKSLGMVVDPRNADFALQQAGGLGQSATDLSSQRMSLKDALLHSTGLFQNSSGTNARDVQWVANYIAKHGLERDKRFSLFRSLRTEAVQSAEARRAQAARALISEAESLRRDLEK